jgi:hypothetical protein
MNAIMGLTELCLETDLNSDQREILETIHGSTGAIYRMMETMIDITALHARDDMDHLVRANHSPAAAAGSDFRKSESSS